MKQIFFRAALTLWGFAVPLHGFSQEPAGYASNMASVHSVSGKPDDPGIPFKLSTGHVIFGLTAADENRQPVVQRLYPNPYKYPSEGYPWCKNNGSAGTGDMLEYMAYALFHIIRFEGPDLIYPHYYTW